MVRKYIVSIAICAVANAAFGMQNQMPAVQPAVVQTESAMGIEQAKACGKKVVPFIKPTLKIGLGAMAIAYSPLFFSSGVYFGCFQYSSNIIADMENIWVSILLGRKCQLLKGASEEESLTKKERLNRLSHYALPFVTGAVLIGSGIKDIIATVCKSKTEQQPEHNSSAAVEQNVASQTN